MNSLMNTLIVGLTLTLGWPVQAQDCHKLKRDMVVSCEALENHCEFIHSCLVRRDTCVDEVPQDRESCTAVAKCSDAIASRFNSREKCDYDWSTTGRKNFCRVKRYFTFYEEGCPGYVGGLLNAFAYGLSGSVDLDFSCNITKVRFDKKEQYCEKARAEFKASCMSAEAQEDLELYRRMKPEACEYSRKFKDYPKEYFKIDDIGKEQFQGRRGPKVQESLPFTDPKKRDKHPSKKVYAQ